MIEPYYSFQPDGVHMHRRDNGAEYRLVQDATGLVYEIVTVLPPRPIGLDPWLEANERRAR